MTHASSRPVVWIACEVYYPEVTASGWYMTCLAESLAEEFDVRVICAQPNGAARSPSREVRNGVTVLRCATPAFDSRRLLRRFAGALFQTAAFAWRAWRRFRPGDTVVVVTNPPTLPYAIAPLARRRGVHTVLYIHDLYPDVLVCAGVLRGRGYADRVLQSFARRLYRSVDLVVADGRDVQRVVAGRTPRPQDVRFIPYWGEANLARARVSAREFVVLYSGTMGRLHDMQTLLGAALELRSHPALRWVLRGGGACRSEVEAFVERHDLTSVALAEHRPWDDLPAVLAACDVGIIAMVAGATGVGTPSRMYNLLAAGKPIVAVTEDDTELAMVIRDEAVGWRVRPGDTAQLAALLRRLADDREAVRAAGERALKLAARYTREKSVSALRALLLELNGSVSRRAAP